MFAVEERERIRTDLIRRADEDPRIVAAAVVGSSATGSDRWSDLDLSFAVAAGVPIDAVMSDWTADMRERYGAATLFDVAAGSTIYRVFLAPGSLQIDLSFGLEGEWGARGPRFHLLFGEAASLPAPVPPTTAHLFGYAVHHVVRAHVSLARGRPWQAEHWIGEAREVAMTLACRCEGLDEQYGRGFDLLPFETRDRYRAMLVGELTLPGLERVLREVAQALLEEASGEPGLVAAVRPVLEPVLSGEFA